MVENAQTSRSWRDGPARLALPCLAAAAVLTAFLPSLQFLVQTWQTVPEYGFGCFVPFVVALLVWQERGRLGRAGMRGAWSGLVLIAAALLLDLLGRFSAIRLFGEYGFVIAIYGLCVCGIGWRGVRVVAVPLAFLFLMIPLPQFVLREFSEQLQLLSSQLGVAIIRLFHISVFLEGNVIDLGSMQLQVADACSGLRYLFPLFTLGLLAAWFHRGATWKRIVIVASTVPLTIAINSLRIGLIGVTVEHWGSGMAEGLLHDFEGWFMFMVCIALLIVEMIVLDRFGPIEPAARPQATDGRTPASTVPTGRIMEGPLLAGIAVLAAVVMADRLVPERGLVEPARSALADFPLQLPGGWNGRADRLGQDVRDVLHLDDYLLTNYQRADAVPVNFYVAYYASQSGGESIHSPRTCMPGGGWQIVEIGDVDVDIGARSGAPSSGLRVNRAVIQRGDQRQLVYFWFRQRGRDLTNEYAVKWFILRDAIVRHRTDGALVRLVTPMPGSEPPDAADRRLLDFLAATAPSLPAYVPS